MRILIIEDEKSLREDVVDYLTENGYKCDFATTIKSALQKLNDIVYSCALVDVGLPDSSGIEIVEHIKKNNPEMGDIIVTAKNALEDKLQGLKIGADDYLTKPFHLSELSARISAVIRRRRFDGSANIIVNEITIDTIANTIFINNKLLDLTKKEYDLLLYLVINKNRVISKSAIAEHISGDNADYFDNFDLQIIHL